MATSYADKFTVTGVKSDRYSDFYKNFNRNFGTKDIAKQTGDDAVISSIRNIIFTRRGERPFNPEFGCSLSNLLFENYDRFVAKNIETEIISAVENFEPRCKIENVSVIQGSDENSVEVYIRFTTINRSEPLTISFLLTRIR